MVIKDINNFNEYIQALKNVDMEGSATDVPEGSRFITISETAWLQILNKLEELK